MALTRAIQAASNAKASTQNRRKALIESLRIHEQVMVDEHGAEIISFRDHDRTSDERFIRAAKAHYQTLTNDEQRNSFSIVFAEWMRAEDTDDRLLDSQQAQVATIRAEMRDNTPLFVAGAFVPDNSGGAA